MCVCVRVRVVGEWKRGRWTPLEQKRLKKNVRRYLKVVESGQSGW